jgi:hypothetical protein
VPLSFFNPENVWVVERALTDDSETTYADLACQMRGWIEVLHDAVPKGAVNPDGSLKEPVFQGTRTIWRLTSAGWSVVQGTHQLAVFAVTVSVLPFVVSGISLLIK